MNELNNKIEQIFFDAYNKLHDNIFASEFEAAKSATQQLQALITEQVRLGRIDELEYFINNINYDHLEEKALRHRLAQLSDTTLLEGDK